MSYCALAIGVILFLAATASKDDSSSSLKKEKYKDKDTNIEKKPTHKEDIKAFANREDLKIEKQSDSLKESKKELEKELEGVRNDGPNNDMAAPVF